MNKKNVIWILIATSLLLIGCLIFGGVMMALNWDFGKLSTVKYETNEYEITDPFQSINIVTDTADITLVPSEDVSVVCTEQENAKHTVSVKDGILQIEIVDQIKWYERIGFNFATPKISVYIPQGVYEMLTIKGSTGDVKIPENYQFERVDIHQSTGDVTCLASTTDNMKIKTSTGSIHVENMSVGYLELSVTTGRITAIDVNCEGDMNVSVSTGKTNLTNVLCKNLTTDGNTGDIMLETVVLLSRKDVYERIKFDVNVEDLQGRASSTATYSEIKAYILEKYGLKVSSLYIAQIKDKCGFEKRDNYNIGEGKSKELICPPEKEQAIMDAFKHFGMLRD